MGVIKENENPFAENGEDDDVFWEEDDRGVDEETGEIFDRPAKSDQPAVEEDDDLYDFDEDTPRGERVKIFEKGDRIDYLAEGLTEAPYWSWSDEDGNWEIGTVFSGEIVKAKVVRAHEFKFKTAPVKRADKGVIYTVAQKEPVVSPKGLKSSEWLITNASPAHISYALFKLMPQIGEMIHIEYEGLGKSSQGSPPRLFTVKVGERGAKPRVWSSSDMNSGSKQEGSAIKKRRKII